MRCMSLVLLFSTEKKAMLSVTSKWEEKEIVQWFHSFSKHSFNINVPASETDTATVFISFGNHHCTITCFRKKHHILFIRKVSVLIEEMAGKLAKLAGKKLKWLTGTWQGKNS